MEPPLEGSISSTPLLLAASTSSIPHLQANTLLLLLVVTTRSILGLLVVNHNMVGSHSTVPVRGLTLIRVAKTLRTKSYIE
jgi:hypothetical protein